MSSFSNFAISFSIICILAGGITSLQFGTSAVGGAAAGIAWPMSKLTLMHQIIAVSDYGKSRLV
jgi:hypothetical protein